MTLLATYLVRQEKPSPATIEVAKEFVAKALIPPRLTRNVLLKYITRAKRNGAWRTLSKEAKALLLVAAKVITEAKSPTLKKALKEALLQIELATVKGKALLYGILIQFRRGTSELTSTLRDLTKTLCIGISYLNNPLTYRIM